MASIWKRATDRNRKGASWYITYADENGRPRTVKGCPDKVATERIAAKLESEADLRRRGVIDPRADALAEHDRRPLAEHLADWHAFLIGKGNTAAHANLSRNRVARLAELARARRLADLTPSRLQAALRRLRDDGMSLRSIHHHVRVVKGFARWLVRDGRLRDDPLAALTPPNPDPDRRHVRRALTAPELARLVEATEAAPPFRGMTGPDRAWLYRVALATGFRAGELASLTPESFALATDPPTVAVKAAYSKRRRDDVQPIPAPLAAALAPWLALQAPGRPVWPLKPYDTALMIRRDLEAAGLPYRTDSGVADFHALRVSYVSALALSNAPVKVVQSLARHSTPTLTLNVYTRLGVFDQSAALEALPDLTRPAPDSEAADLAATGTDPVTIPCHRRAAPAQRREGRNGRGGADPCGSAGASDPACRPDAPARKALDSRGLADPGASERKLERRGGDSNPRGRLSRPNGLANRPPVSVTAKPTIAFRPEGVTRAAPAQRRGRSKGPERPPVAAPALPADLAGIVAAWAELPEAIRAGVVALVEAARTRGGTAPDARS